MIILERSDLEKLLDMDEVIETIEEAFLDYSKGKTETPQRTSVKLQTDRRGQILYMPCCIYSSGSDVVIGIKVYTEFLDNFQQGLPISHAAILLIDPDDGRPSTLMEGMYVTGLRTGAVSAVAGKYLVSEDSQSLGLIGAGFQGYFQAWAISRVRNFKEIGLYDPSEKQMKKLCEKLDDVFEGDVITFDSSRSLVNSSDVLITATSSTEPVFDGKLISPGMTIFAMGSYNPDSRELDSEVIKNSSIFVDSRQAALKEAGDLVIPIEQNEISQGKIEGELGELIAGEKKGRTDSSQICLFKSVGLAFEDMALAKLAYERAVDEGVGESTELFSG